MWVVSLLLTLVYSESDDTCVGCGELMHEDECYGLDSAKCALSVLQRRSRVEISARPTSICREGVPSPAFNLPSPRPAGSAGLQCEARISQMSSAAKDFWTLMDPPLDLPNRSLHGPGWEAATHVYNRTIRFGSGYWMWPPGDFEEGVRILYIKGCDSVCYVDKPYYSTLTTRLAKWANAPLLAKNYLQYPEHPWPGNVRAVLADLQECLTSTLPSSRPVTRCYLAGDSVGALTLMQTVMALKDPTLRSLLSVPTDLTIANVTGIGLFSPVLDTACNTPSLYNSTPGPATWSQYGNMTHEQAFLWCAYSYLEYFGGLPVEQTFGNWKAGINYTEVRNELRHWPKEYWVNPQINPLFANLTGMPPLFIVSATGDYYDDDSRDIASRACQASVDVETYIAEGLWHCFIEYSEGACRQEGSQPLLEGLEAYSGWGSFVQRTK